MHSSNRTEIKVITAKQAVKQIRNRLGDHTGQGIMWLSDEDTDGSIVGLSKSDDIFHIYPNTRGNIKFWEVGFIRYGLDKMDIIRDKCITRKTAIIWCEKYNLGEK